MTNPHPISPFDALPAELLLILHAHLPLDSFLDLALVIYPTLLRHRMVPALTPPTYNRIIANARRLTPSSRDPGLVISRVPLELWFQIAGYLEPGDSVALVWALGPGFWRWPRRLGGVVEGWLGVWSRRSRAEEGDVEDEDVAGE